MQTGLVSTDLKSGNLTSAQNDVSGVQNQIAKLRARVSLPAGNIGAGPAGNIGTGQPGGQIQGFPALPTLSGLQAYNSLEQGAFNSALSLSLPASMSGLSLQA